MKTSFNDRQGSRDRKIMCLIITGDGVIRALPGRHVAGVGGRRVSLPERLGQVRTGVTMTEKIQAHVGRGPSTYVNEPRPLGGVRASRQERRKALAAAGKSLRAICGAGAAEARRRR